MNKTKGCLIANFATVPQKQRQALEDEVAAFLARGGRITEVPPDEHSDR
ncbi:hypothetical protein RX522_003098 [Acinetobacter baumannii]|nr:hypothetical protein [Acinetobacter baumannii]